MKREGGSFGCRGGGGQDKGGGRKVRRVIERWRRRLGPYSVQSIGAAEAVSLAFGHNPGRLATPTKYTSMLALILPTSEGRQVELTPPGINSTVERDLNSGP